MKKPVKIIITFIMTFIVLQKEFWSKLFSSLKKTKDFLYLPSEDVETLHSLWKLVSNIQERLLEMALNLDALMAEVEHTKGVQESAIVLLKNLTVELGEISAKLAETPKEEPVDTSGLDALVAKLKDSTDALADAVAANSPAPAPVDETPSN